MSDAQDPKFLVIAEYGLAADRRETVLGLLTRLAEASRTEPGNLSYEALLDPADAGRIVIVEKYRTAEDYATHRSSPHFQEIAVDAIIPLLDTRLVQTYSISAP